MTNREDAEILRHEAFGCFSCDSGRFGFEKPQPDAGYYKFPPTIGAPTRAHLLFVGFNPRRSNTNLNLHTRVMSSLASFDDLSRDRDQGLPYLESEPYYRDILTVATAAFPGRAFSEVASSTELFLCATVDMKRLGGPNPCAPRFLHRVVPLVEPDIIIPVGRMVARYFEAVAGVATGERFIVEIGGHRAHVVPIPRKAWSNALSPGETYERQLQAATIRVVELVNTLGLSQSSRHEAQLVHGIVGLPIIEASRATSDGITSKWAAVLLTGGRRDTRAMVLGAIPDSKARLRRLTTGLSVNSLVGIANVLFNDVTPRKLELAIPGDLICQARLAWSYLDTAKTNPRLGGKWAKTAEALQTGADNGLSRVKELGIVDFVTAALRVVSQVYRKV